MSKNQQINPPMRQGGHGPRGPVMPGEKPKEFRKTFSKLIKYMRGSTVGIIIAIVLAVISVVLTIFLPKVTALATDELFGGIFARDAYKAIDVAFSAQSYPTLALISEAEGINSITELMSHATYGEFATSIVNEIKVADSYKSYILNMQLESIPSVNVIALTRTLLTAIILVAISAVIGYIQGIILSEVALKVSYKFRRDIDQKFNKLPLKYFDKKTNGEVLSYLTNDIDTITNTLNQSLSQLITSFTTVIGVLVMMLTISPILTLIAVLIVPFSMLLVFIVVRLSQKHFINQQRYLGNVNGHIEEMYAGHTVIQLYNAQDDVQKTFNDYNEKLAISGQKAQFLSGLMMPATQFVGNVGYVATCVVGGLLAINGKISIGDIQAFTQYVRQFNNPLSQIANIMNTIQSAIAAAERVFGILDEKEEVETGDKIPQNVLGNVEFENVRFGYDDDKIIIKGFSSKVKAGSRVAIVGPTGAGKTTMVKLLMRYYELNGGKILLDGVDVTEYTRNGLRAELGMVLQDTWLYNGTILDNIRYGRLDATDEECIEAAKTACADHFIRTLPGGYNFVINEEAGNISQGQKQLLTIARAVLADPKVLILDEATSSVDTRTELLIQKAMDRLMSGRTSFIIAHRLSTIKDADKILVMRDGDIVEQGNHNELMSIQDGFYRQLYNSQFA